MSNDSMHNNKLSYFADDLIQQEIIQLTEDEEYGGENEVPHWPHFMQVHKDNVKHNNKIY